MILRKTYVMIGDARGKTAFRGVLHSSCMHRSWTFDGILGKTNKKNCKRGGDKIE